MPRRGKMFPCRIKGATIEIIKTFFTFMHDIVAVIKTHCKEYKIQANKNTLQKRLWPNPYFRSINYVDNSVIVK